MVREKDPMWKYAEELNPGFKCKFCGFESRGTITRLKWHLAQIEVQGIKPCKAAVPSQVQEEVRQAIGDASRKRKAISSSTNEEVNYTPSASLQVQDNEVPEDLIGDAEMIGTDNVIAGGVKEVGHQMDTMSENLTQRVDGDASEIRGDEFLTKKLEGEQFQEHMGEILYLLKRNDALRIGIYGIGGVGKTELIMQVCNKLLQNPNTHGHVYWVTVSPNSNIHKLQYAIAKAVGLDFSKENNENKRAVKLLKVLGNKKSVLILDDVWDYVPLDLVGIPVAISKFKLVLTTRSLDVCRMTGCQNTIKVECLYGEEAWNLFKENLVLEKALPPKVERIAKSVAGHCAGLPLGIISMARSLRAVTNLHQWRNALTELRGHIPRQDNMKVFQKLKLSYDYLNDSSLQQCFLYCVLFPNYKCDDLIEFLIDEGIIEGTESRSTEFDKGHTMLNTLANVGLLEDCLYVKLDSLIRDMAMKILKVNSPVMIEAYKQLEEVPDEDKWTENLVRVSLMCNDIKEIPSSFSPNCPNLSTLLLNYNRNLESIAGSFFKQLHGLKVLNLSNTGIQGLPDSISDLVNLRALLVKRCENLKHVPLLAKLRALRRLDLSYTGLEEAPEGLELLGCLKYLNLEGTQIELQAGILRKLSNLQFLKLGSDEVLTVVEGEEVASLKKLDVLLCGFNDVDNFNIFVQSVKECQLKKQMYHGLTADWDVDDYSPSKYNIHVGENKGDLHLPGYYYRLDLFSREVFFMNCNINRGGGGGGGGGGESQLILPKNIECLVIVKCSGGRSLCLENATELKFLYISGHVEMEWFSSRSADFQELEFLRLDGLNNLRALFGTEGSSAALPLPTKESPSNATFSCLKMFEICGCPNIRKLFPRRLLQNLQNLYFIRVEHCERMEEIIATEEPGKQVMSQQFNLPSLHNLQLNNLPELKSICKGQLICNSLWKFDVSGCPKLANGPVNANGKRWSFTTERWES